MPEPTPIVPVAASAAAQKSGMSMIVKLFLGLVYTLFVAGVAATATFVVVKALEPPQTLPVNSNPNPVPNLAPAPQNPPATPPAPAPVPVTIYFYKGPFTQADSTPGTLTLVPATRQTTSTDPYTFAFDQLALGPTTAEATQGERVAFGFSGTSNCSGADFTLTKVSTTWLKVNLCRDLDLSNQTPAQGGAYAGMTLAMESNAREEIKKTLKFDGITTVEVRDSSGQCYAPDVQDSDCTPN